MSLLDDLRKERDELTAAIAVLERREGVQRKPAVKAASGTKPAAKVGATKPHGRVWSQKDREAMSRRVKLALAKKKKAKTANA